MLTAMHLALGKINKQNMYIHVRYNRLHTNYSMQSYQRNKRHLMQTNGKNEPNIPSVNIAVQTEKETSENREQHR